MTSGGLAEVAVVGTGLIGTSIALALRAAGSDVVLYDADADAARHAAELGAGTPAGHVLAERPGGLPPADVAVLAVPPAAVAGVLEAALGVGLAAVLTDVASVKGHPQREAERRGLDVSRYVGGHPMAGRERSGPRAARGDLFAGRPWVLAPGPRSSASAVAAVRALAAACGAVPVVLDPQRHDAAVALVSHAPHLLAALMAARLRAAPEEAVGLAGQGVRDVTRIAASDPVLWRSILTANAGPVHDVLAAVRDDLDGVLLALDALAAGDDGAGERLEGLLRDGVAGRARIPGKHGAPPTTYAAVPVVVPDRPGELARLFVAAGEAGVNVEDVAIEHSPGQPVGLVELAVRPDRADELSLALRARGWTVQR